MNSHNLYYTKTSQRAHSPRRMSPMAAGVDLKSEEDKVIPAGGRDLVNTGLRIQVPNGSYGRLAPRSSLAVKHHVTIDAGVIDADYRGEVKVVLVNFGKEDFVVKNGDRICQLICEKIIYATPKKANSLNKTKRGDGGFGSTGK